MKEKLRGNYNFWESWTDVNDLERQAIEKLKLAEIK